MVKVPQQPPRKWIMSDEELERLKTLVFQITQNNNVRLSWSMDYESLDIMFVSNEKPLTVTMDSRSFPLDIDLKEDEDENPQT